MGARPGVGLPGRTLKVLGIFRTLTICDVESLGYYSTSIARYPLTARMPTLTPWRSKRL